MSDLKEIEIPAPLPIAVAQQVSVSKAMSYKPANRFAAACLWPVWPLLDPHTGRPSAPRCMAWAIYVAFMVNRPIPAMVCALLLATVFGYSMFKEALGKATLNATSSDVVTLAHEYSEKIDHTITETRGPTGEALRSLPAVPNATTPSGDG